MSRLRRINGVLHNFLGTYTSRNILTMMAIGCFGFLLSAILLELNIDLLNSAGEGTTTPLAAVHQIAVMKFREQMEQTGLNISRVREAHLYLNRLPEPQRGPVNGHIRSGYNVRFLLKVIDDNAKSYERETTIFVAPHDSQIEQRSNRVA